jgi:hypothetical protein
VGWRAVLREFHVPLHEFHAKTVMRREGLFKRGSHDKHTAFLKALGEIVAECRIYPICFGLFVEDFFRFSLEERRFLTGATWDGNQKRFLSTGCPEKPYFVAFNECLKVVAYYTPICARADFFFGTDRPVAGYARNLFVDLKEKPTVVSTERFGAIGFPLASETPRLQAADLFSVFELSAHARQEKRRQMGIAAIETALGTAQESERPIRHLLSYRGPS